MSLRIRQIVLAARDLDTVVAQLTSVLGVDICYHDPEVGKFGLRNALMTIGHKDYVQFLEVVSPTQDNTTAGRHLDRHGDSGYMLILQTEDLARDRARFEKMNVRMVWQATHADISAVHLHPKDIGGAIVSLDQPIPPPSWRWAGPEWKNHLRESGAQLVQSVTMAAHDASAMSKRWAEVLGTSPPTSLQQTQRIEIEAGNLEFKQAKADVIAGFTIAMADRSAALAEARKQALPVNGNSVTICGTEFLLT